MYLILWFKLIYQLSIEYCLKQRALLGHCIGLLTLGNRQLTIVKILLALELGELVSVKS